MRFTRDPRTGLIVPKRDIQVIPGLSKMNLQWFAESGGKFILDAEDAGDSPYEFDSLQEEGDNTIAPSADAKSDNTGSTNGYKITFDGTNDFAYGVLDFTEEGELFVRMYVLIPTSLEIGTWKELRFLTFLDGGVDRGNVGFESQGDVYGATWQMRWGGANQQNNTHFTLDAWHYIEFRFHQDGATGGGQMYVDGDSIMTDLDQDTSAIAIDSLWIGSVSCSGVPGAEDYFYIDDIKGATSYIGPYSDAGGGSIVPILENQRRRRCI